MIYKDPQDFLREKKVSPPRPRSHSPDIYRAPSPMKRRSQRSSGRSNRSPSPGERRHRRSPSPVERRQRRSSSPAQRRQRRSSSPDRRQRTPSPAKRESRRQRRSPSPVESIPPPPPPLPDFVDTPTIIRKPSKRKTESIKLNFNPTTLPISVWSFQGVTLWRPPTLWLTS